MTLQDVPLFEGIVNDLFPSQDWLQETENILEEGIGLALKKKNLQVI